MEALKDLDPIKTAKELIAVNYSSTEYEAGVQDQRKRQLETFKNAKVDVLINMAQEIIDFGEQVLKILREHEKNTSKNKS